jgi:hypothetical protein
LELGGYCGVISLGDLERKYVFIFSIKKIIDDYLTASSRSGIPLADARTFLLG